MSPRPFLPTTLLAFASVFGAPLAFAQAGEALKEIIVTANFRDTTLMQTVGSVSMITQNTITERAAQHLQDILSAAPNVTVTAGASRGRFVQICGVGELEQLYDPKYYPAVGIMLDDMELGDTASAGILFDIAQVEVLRGPQGTRFGANGHAGMVFMHSNAPTDEFEAELSGGGNYDSYNLELVSCPLSSQSSGRLKIEGQDDTFFGYYHDGGLDSCKLINASLRWQSVTLWGRNLGDEDYAVHELYFGNESRDDFALSRTRLTCSPVSLSFMVLNYCIPSEVLMV